jgi:hypothetical protein
MLWHSLTVILAVIYRGVAMVDETEDEKFARTIEENSRCLKRIREGVTGTLITVSQMGFRLLEEHEKTEAEKAEGVLPIGIATGPIWEGLMVDTSAVDELQAAADELRSTAIAQSLRRIDNALRSSAFPSARGQNDNRMQPAVPVGINWITQTLAAHPELRKPRQAAAWIVEALKAWPQSEGQSDVSYRQELSDLSKTAKQKHGKGWTPDYLRTVLEGKSKR